MMTNIFLTLEKFFLDFLQLNPINIREKCFLEYTLFLREAKICGNYSFRVFLFRISEQVFIDRTLLIFIAVSETRELKESAFMWVKIETETNIYNGSNQTNCTERCEMRV